MAGLAVRGLRAKWSSGAVELRGWCEEMIGFVPNLGGRRREI